MSSWRSGRGLQWQPVKLWWTPCPRGLRQCWKIMVATQNIDTLGPIWTFSLRGVLTFVASGLDINGCVLSYFEGTANLHCYTSCTLTTLHCSKVSFLKCCHMKRYNKIFTKMWGVYSLLWDTVCCRLEPQTSQCSRLFTKKNSSKREPVCVVLCVYLSPPFPHSMCSPWTSQKHHIRHFFLSSTTFCHLLSSVFHLLILVSAFPFLLPCTVLLLHSLD